jgi:hypothetical protein
MRNPKNSLILSISIYLIAGLFSVNSVSVAQEKSDEDLKKEFVPILGEYAFESGGATFTLRFYIENNALWADSGDGRPATMKPIEDEVFAFTAEDPISGLFEIKFPKDDHGEYTRCQVINQSMGMEIEGTKIK